VRSSFVWVAVVLLTLQVSAGFFGIQKQQPEISAYHPLDSRYTKDSPLSTSSPAILELSTSLFSDQQEIHFDSRQITFTRTDQLGFELWRYHYNELSDYLLSRNQFALYKNYVQKIHQAQKDRKKPQRSWNSLQFDLPVEYPDWAKRVMGDEPPRLTITGNLKITLGYDHTNTTPTDRARNISSFTFDQENNFTIRGTVGRLIDINISASSAEGFDLDNPLKKFKVEYKATDQEDRERIEDEIVQEVVAGYTGFSLPGTHLSGYSESHEGLFGIKVRTKLGPLELTGVASHEQGEAQILNFTNSPTASGNKTQLWEFEFAQNTFFYLDSLYLTEALKKAANPAYEPQVPAVKKLEVWLQVDALEISQKTLGRDYAQLDLVDGKYNFKRLIRDVEYQLIPDEGYVIFDSVAIDQNKMIGIYLETEDPGLIPTKGDTTITIDSTQRSTNRLLEDLWILKSKTPVPTDSTFHLMWRNVYRMPAEVSDDFEITVEKIISGQDTTKQFNGLPLSHILGLADKSGNAYRQRTEIFGSRAEGGGYLVIPPFANEQIGNQPFRNPALGDTTVFFYTTEPGVEFSRRQIDKKFLISMTGATSRRQTTFNLGWGVMRGTERVIADGEVLERDRDYDIDYDIGTLALKSAKAKAAQNIRAEYQREAIFIPERKVFLGARAEMKLPFISDRSFVGASVLWQNVGTKDRIPRIGHEPYNKILLDINTKIDFEPVWLTELIQRAPFLSATGASRINFEFEIAHSRMNPNTDGEAIVDDFEASKQVFPLGESRHAWHRGSPPVDFVNDSTGGLLRHPPALDWYWFSPVEDDAAHRVSRLDNWEIDTASIRNQSYDPYERVLRWVVRPTSQALRERYENPWASIMTSLSSSFANREDDQFFEFWMRNPNGGKLTIDMGYISEDLSLHGAMPNGINNDEDTTGSGLIDYNIQLDKGLDLVVDTAEYLVVPSPDKTSWDTLRYNNPLLPYPSDPSIDNFRLYDNNNTANFRWVSRTQGDAAPLTSEDINYDGSLSRMGGEAAFRYVIDFDSLNALTNNNHQAFFRVNDANAKPGSGWNLFRIPLQVDTVWDTVQASAGGVAPSWRQVQFVRLTWSGFNKDIDTLEQAIEFTRMQFVGNQWRTISSVDTTTSQQPKIQASAINTDEDTLYRQMHQRGEVPVDRETDSRGNPRREQALVLNVQDLGGQQEAIVSRQFSFEPLNLSTYRDLNMVVYSKEDLSLEEVQFVLRMGIDSANYYEYRTDYLHKGWSPDNFVNFQMQQFTDLKLAYYKQFGDSLQPFTFSDSTGQFRIVSQSGRQPSFARIEWIGMGLVRQSSSTAMPIDAEVWVNELTVRGIRALNGYAARTILQADFSDFASLSVNSNYEDGDFRRMTENHIGSDESTLDGNVSFDLNLEKFFNRNAGISFPLNVKTGGRITRPQQRPPNSDIFLTDNNGQSDRIDDMARDGLHAIAPALFEEDDKTTKAEEYETREVTRGFSTSFSKNRMSENLLTHFTLDRINLSGSYQGKSTEQLRGTTLEGGVVKDSSTRDTWRGELGYDLSPKGGANWSKFRPFEAWSDIKWLPPNISRYEFNLLPSQLRFTLADAAFEDTYIKEARQDVGLNTETFSLNHSLSLSYTPISPILDFNYSLSVRRNMDDLVSGAHGIEAAVDSVDGDIFSRHDQFSDYGLLASEVSRSQQFSSNWRPKLVSWLSHDFGYKTSYMQQVVNRSGVDSTTDYLDLSLTSDFSLNGSFEISQLAQKLESLFKNESSLQKAFSSVEKGLSRIRLRQIRYRYSAQSQIINTYISRNYLREQGKSNLLDLLQYQMGLEFSSARDFWLQDIDDEKDFGGMRTVETVRGRDNRAVKQSYNLSSSFFIPDPIDINFQSVSFGANRSFTVRPDTTRWDTVVVYPDISLNASTGFFNNLPLVQKHMSDLSVRSNFSYRKTKRLSSQQPVFYERQLSFRPLIRAEGRLRVRPIRLSYSVDLDRSTDNTFTQLVEQQQGEDQRQERWGRDYKQSHQASVSYEVRHDGKEEKPLNLLFAKIPIEGKIVYELFANYDISKVYKEKDSEAALRTDPQQQQSTFSFSPQVRYDFTRNITGTGRYTFERTNDNTVTRTTNRVSVIVEVRF